MQNDAAADQHYSDAENALDQLRDAMEEIKRLQVAADRLATKATESAVAAARYYTHTRDRDSYDGCVELISTILRTRPELTN